MIGDRGRAEIMGNIAPSALPGIRLVLAIAVILLGAAPSSRRFVYVVRPVGRLVDSEQLGRHCRRTIRHGIHHQRRNGGHHSARRVCTSLYLGDPNSTYSGTIQMSDGDLSVSLSEYLGNSGSGTFIQSGGTNRYSGSASNGSLYLGYNSASSGSYSLSDSGILFAGNEYTGYSGSGTFTQSGGTNTVTSVFALGGGGTYNLSGGALLVPGIQGTGSFNLGGGTLVANASILGQPSHDLDGQRR